MAEFDEAAEAATRLEAALERIAERLARQALAGTEAVPPTGEAPTGHAPHGHAPQDDWEAMAAERAAEQARTAEVAARLDELITQLRAALARADGGDAGSAPTTAPGVSSGSPPGQP
jgi:hypothetical protein